MLRRLYGALGSWPVLIFGVFYYISFGRTPSRSYQAMIRIFCLTKGYGLDVFNFMIRSYKNLLGQRLILPRNDHSDPINDLRGVDFVVSALRNQGYCAINSKIPKDLLDAMVDFSLNNESTMRNEQKSEVYTRGKPQSVRYDFSAKTIVGAELFNDLLTSTFALKVATSYLGCRPWLDVLGMWWHTAFAKEPDSEAAQLYHFDMDRPKWIKVFIYLTDVAGENGPHCFVEGSHRSGAVPRSLLRRGYARIQDCEVYQLFGANKEKQFIGPAGTVIFEDTRGLHKGLHVHSGDRLIFQMQFSNSKFGTAYPELKQADVNVGLRERLSSLGLPCTLFS